jgi:hypothetical protein
VVDKVAKKEWESQQLVTGRWSRVLYLAHDDLLGISGTAPPAGGTIVCEIEVVRVEPGDRLRRRYGNPEVFTPDLGLGNNL